MLCLVDTEDKMFPAAWSGEDDTEKGRSNVDEEEKKTFNSSYEIILDYSEYSTIQVHPIITIST